jgi:thiamine biosynthesis lipoprotein
VLFLILLLNGCGDALQEFGGPTMGSRYSLKYVQAEGVPPRERLQAEVEGILVEIDRQMSTWRADSDLSRFNQLPAGACFAMPEPVLQLVRFGAQLSASSEGAFDLTVQPLMDLWGFGAQSRGRRVPAAEEIAAVLPAIGQRHLRIDGERLCKDVFLRVDLDAIAAGAAVDRIAARLSELGVRSFLLEITGELKAVGRKPDGSPWTVAIEAPLDEGREEQLRLALDGLGVSTSGDYRRPALLAYLRPAHGAAGQPRSGLGQRGGCLGAACRWPVDRSDGAGSRGGHGPRRTRGCRRAVYPARRGALRHPGEHGFRAPLRRPAGAWRGHVAERKLAYAATKR